MVSVDDVCVYIYMYLNNICLDTQSKQEEPSWLTLDYHPLSLPLSLSLLSSLSLILSQLSLL